MSLALADYWKLLAGYLREQRLAVAGLAVLLVGGIAFQLVNPLVLRRFIDDASAGAAVSALVGVALLFLGIALAQQVAEVLATWTSENVGWRATNAMRRDVMEHCLRLDAPFHNARTPGELIERIDGDVTALANFFSQLVIQIVGSAVLLVGVIAFLAREDWRVAAAMGLLTAVGLVALDRLRRLAGPRWVAAFEARAELGGYLEERLAATEDIRSSGAGEHTSRGLHVLMGRIMRRFRSAMLTGHHVWVAANLLVALGLAIGVGLGAWLYLRGEATIGTVYMIGFYGRLLAFPLEELTTQMQDLQQASAAISRVRELVSAESAVRDGPGVDLPQGPLSVELRDVSFAYGAEPVLNSLSFRLEPGERLGLLGRTGSGKTTITRLLFRLYDPTDGRILLGGEDVRRARLGELRGRIGLVTQEVQLFHGSVRDNLTFFDPSVGDERIVSAIAGLGLTRWLEALPVGLDTHLTGSRALSAGEAQLLALTRVFLEDPGLVVLDEPTSRIDPATERLIDGAVERLLAGRTAIVVAHRLSTVTRVDSILILEGGRCLEHGPRAQLAADPESVFARLLRTGAESVLA